MKTYRVEVGSVVKTIKADFFIVQGEYAQFFYNGSPEKLVAVVRNPDMVKEQRDGDAEGASHA